MSADNSLLLLFQKIASEKREEEEEEVILLKRLCITALLCKYLPPSPDLFLNEVAVGALQCAAVAAVIVHAVSSEHTY